MIGTIESYDPESETGTVKSEENVYSFQLVDWVADVAPEAGDDVKFEAEDGAAKSVDLVGAYLEPPKPVKYKYLAALLSFLFGFAGLSRLYLGFYRLALIQVIITVVLWVTQYFLVYAPVWGFIDAVLILAGHLNKDAKGRPLK